VREQVLAAEGPGSTFAELSVFDGGNYPASASALEDSELVFVSRKDFQNFCREHPNVALKVIAIGAPACDTWLGDWLVACPEGSVRLPTNHPREGLKPV
jgi:Cyclic nucleotide-binding domain